MYDWYVKSRERYALHWTVELKVSKRYGIEIPLFQVSFHPNIQGVEGQPDKDTQAGDTRKKIQWMPIS